MSKSQFEDYQEAHPEEFEHDYQDDRNDDEDLVPAQLTPEQKEVADSLEAHNKIESKKYYEGLQSFDAKWRFLNYVGNLNQNTLHD